MPVDVGHCGRSGTCRGELQPVEAGVTLFHGSEATYSATYEDHFSADTQQHGFFVVGTRTF